MTGTIPAAKGLQDVRRPLDDGGGRRAKGASQLQDRIWAGSLAVVSVGVGVFMIAPSLVVMLTSLGGDEIAFPPERISVSSYAAIGGYFYDALWLSVRVAIVVVVLSLVLALPAALSVARRRGPISDFVSWFLSLPVQVPSIVKGLALYQFFILVHGVAGFVGAEGFWPLVVGHIVLVFPFVFGTLLGRAVRLDENLQLAAEGLGAGPIRRLFAIDLPLMRPAIISGGFLAFLLSFDDLPVSIFLSPLEGPTLPVTLFTTAETRLTPSVFAISAMVVVGSMLVSGAIDRIFSLRTVLSK